jgi:nucleotide-binding universal stress UspA family protein
MSDADPSDLAVLQQIFHPSDFTPASEVAFVHALKAALVAKAELTILHVSPKHELEWMEFPGVRPTLERWGLLPKQSARSDVAKLGINIKKVQAKHDDPVESVTSYLSTHNTDLIVLATDQHKSGGLWLSRSIAAPIARKSRQMTLFIPKGVDGSIARRGSLRWSMSESRPICLKSSSRMCRAGVGRR